MIETEDRNVTDDSFPLINESRPPSIPDPNTSDSVSLHAYNRLTCIYVSLSKVIVTAHIPPGVHTPNGIVWMYEKFNTKLMETLQRYASIIVGLHFGHDHADGFKILPDSHGNVRKQTELYCFTFDGLLIYLVCHCVCEIAFRTNNFVVLRIKLKRF